jgi:hypothetical protein
MVPLVYKAIKVISEQQALMEAQVPLDKTVLKASKAQKDHRVPLALKANRGLMVRLAKMVRQDSVV